MEKKGLLTQREFSYINRLMVADKYGEDETIKTKLNIVNTKEWRELLEKLFNFSYK